MDPKTATQVLLERTHNMISGMESLKVDVKTIQADVTDIKISNSGLACVANTARIKRLEKTIIFCVSIIVVSFFTYIAVPTKGKIQKSVPKKISTVQVIKAKHQKQQKKQKTKSKPNNSNRAKKSQLKDIINGLVIKQ